VNIRVRPMYTSDIKNRQHRSMLERQQIGIGKSPMLMLKKMDEFLFSTVGCTAVSSIDVSHTHGHR